MACSPVTTNWLELFKSRLSCPDAFSLEEYRAGIIGIKIEKLVCKCPNALDEETESTCHVSSYLKLSQLLSSIECGNGISELDYYWALAVIELKSLQCCETYGYGI